MEKSKVQSLVIREVASVFKKYYGWNYEKMLEMLDILTKAITVFKNYEKRHKNDNTENRKET